VRYLGSPVGSNEYKAAFINSRIDTHLVPLLEQIRKIHHPHICLHLLRRAVVKAGFMLLARTVPPWVAGPAFERVNKLIRSVLEECVFNHNLNDLQYRLVLLPTTIGGWSIPDLVLINECGYAASLSSCLTQVLALRPSAAPRLRVHLERAVELITTKHLSSVPLPVRAPYKQADLTRLIHQARRDKLILDATAAEELAFKAIALAEAEDNAGKWKIAPASFDFILEPDLFVLSARRSVHLPIYETERIIGDTLYDRYGHKALSYRSDGNLTRRHNHIAKFLHATGVLGHVEQHYEKTLPLINVPHRPDWRADLYYPAGIPGITHKPLCIDVTVMNSLGEAIFSKSTVDGAAASLRGQEAKDSLLRNALSLNGYVLLPVAFSTSGGCNEKCRPYIDYLLRQRAIHTRTPLEEVTHDWWSRLSVQIQRDNAEILKGLRDDSLPLSSDQERISGDECAK
jgi:hypothetical protein